MALLEKLILGVGTGVAKGAVKLWLKDEAIASMTGLELVTLLAKKTNDRPA